MDNNEASRKEFEAHMISIGMATYLHYENDNQQYSNLPTQRLWKCWQAAKVASADVLVEALEYLKEHRLWANSHAKAIIESALATYDKLSEVKHEAT